MALKRMDNAGSVVDDLGGAMNFFQEPGLDLEGRGMIEGERTGHVTGLADRGCDDGAPDGHSRLKLSRFHTPPVIADHRNAPMNALGYLRVMFVVEDTTRRLTGFASAVHNSWAK